MAKNKDNIAGFNKIDIAKLEVAESNPKTKVTITQKGNIRIKETRTKIS